MATTTYYVLDTAQPTFDADLAECDAEFAKLFPGNRMSIAYTNGLGRAIVKVVADNALTLASEAEQFAGSNATLIARRQAVGIWNDDGETPGQIISRAARFASDRTLLPRI